MNMELEKRDPLQLRFKLCDFVNIEWMASFVQKYSDVTLVCPLPAMLEMRRLPLENIRLKFNRDKTHSLQFCLHQIILHLQGMTFKTVGKYNYYNIELPPKNMPFVLPKGDYKFLGSAYLTKTNEKILEITIVVNGKIKNNEPFQLRFKLCDFIKMEWIASFVEKYSNVKLVCPVPPDSHEVLYDLEAINALDYSVTIAPCKDTVKDTKHCVALRIKFLETKQLLKTLCEKFLIRLRVFNRLDVMTSMDRYHQRDDNSQERWLTVHTETRREWFRSN
ncbi:hypothetical protein EVAR_29831_1 [Eumeta japonica]|uniref:Uncharacterized protein n=1 Tax=Eumeta variegata TaxID=151549 RepID=A0A4C1VWE5_EUMVA|nr:hypothetical protein EVAR_29831_1 [Eumeta japonica]